MAEHKIYPVKKEIQSKALITKEAYKPLYRQSIENPEQFWKEQGHCIEWIKPYSKIKNTSYHAEDFHIRWYEDGTLNACFNCLDRHLGGKGEQIALLWEGDTPGEKKSYTYRALHEEVCKFSNVLRSLGVKKGDRVTIYLPMIPEAAISMLACARIGAIHSVVFGGFSSESLANRIIDCDSALVITADEGMRGGKPVPLKQNTDEALAQAGVPSSVKVIVVKRTGNPVPFKKERDFWYHERMGQASSVAEIEEMNAEDPFFVLYTSGSTGKPKGVLHTTGGYLVYATLTFKYVFDYHDGDIYWCTADVGWVTGHTYGIYGPLSNGATLVMFEGIPSYPDFSRFWAIIDQYKVNIFYTAPTVLRALMREGNEPVLKTKRSSLRVLGTVGEPINPEAWEWYYHIIGEERCPIVDTWWQTETGGILITPLVGAIDLKPGSATLPFFGIQPAIVDNEGKILEGEAEGSLVIADSWPGQMRTVYGDHDRFIKTYFTLFKGKYFTGDGARRDKDGYYWITGRIDDVINVSGHRLGTAEIESALNSHPSVAESAVVGFPHDIKGQGIYAYVMLFKDVVPSKELEKELMNIVQKHISPIAKPDLIHWAPNLPRTRSGKIMRRILRKIAGQEFDSLGDVSTLADPSIVEVLIKEAERLLSA